MEKKNNKEIIRIAKFFLFSASAGIIQIVTFTLLNELTSLPYWFVYLSTLALSVIYNFTLNREFTFKSANNVPIAMMKVFVYYCFFTPVTTIAGNWIVTNKGINEYIVTIINMILNFVTEYLYDELVVFKGSIDTNKRA